MVIVPENKIVVFISSKIDSSFKYRLARKAIRESLVNTGLFNVYSFEETGPSTASALVHYKENIKYCDVCIFLIDNDDDVPDGVATEIQEVNKYNIPSIYYFCEGEKREITATQKAIMKPGGPKIKEIKTFEDFIKNGAKDLIDDILFIYKRYTRGNLVQVEDEENEDVILDKSVYKATTILKKDQLANYHSRQYFAKMIFGDRDEKSNSLVEKNLDYYCSLFLPVLFENTAIERFNTGLFLKELKYQLDDKYYAIVSLRWEAIESYFNEDVETSIAKLKEAFKKAEELQIEEWMIQDILIDLRNQIYIYHEKLGQFAEKNEGKELLDLREEKLYYPLIDRYEKDLLSWIIEDSQKNEIRSFRSQRFLGDLSVHSNKIADIYFQSMAVGSITHLTRIYGLIQKLCFHISSHYENWPSLMLTLKNSIILLDRTKIHQLVRHFELLLGRMNDRDAKEVFDYSNNLILDYQRFQGNLLAISEVGYYLSDVDFDDSWNGIKDELNKWAKSKVTPYNIESQIFKTIHKIKERISSDYIIEFGLLLIGEGKNIYYSNVFEMWARDVDYESVMEKNKDKVVQTVIAYLENRDNKLQQNGIKELCCILGRNKVHNLDILEEKIKEAMPDFYNLEYLLETRNDVVTNQDAILRYTDEIREDNKAQGENGIYSHSGNSPYQFIRFIISQQTERIPKSILDALFVVSTEAVTSTKQLIEVKTEAIKLLMFLNYYDPNIGDRNSESIKLLIEGDYLMNENQSMVAYLDNNLFELAVLLLKSCLGNEVWADLLNSLSKCSSSGAKITACKFIQVYLGDDTSRINDDEKALIFQFVLEWSTATVIEVRWEAVNILITLLQVERFQKIITTRLVQIMSQDNALVKSRLVHAAKKIGKHSEDTEEYIYQHALIDSNYVLREIVRDKYPDR
ncbi:hypothetical protein [Paenilisteria newyorkensis]|uniref:hypothetical protein n=1 Tax=Listeria newyorkensis TaxID=1497681 RepID=UPI00235A37FC|nr:hypothetical protein [Listeria newyorkensis]WAO22681.1 hypothetical protein OTR81_05250 [Listeria newyorkensis]